MPCVYATVIHSLINLGGLERGMSVLIHSACGGVGIAAIQICRMVGAEVCRFPFPPISSLDTIDGRTCC